MTGPMLLLNTDSDHTGLFISTKLLNFQEYCWSGWSRQLWIELSWFLGLGEIHGARHSLTSLRTKRKEIKVGVIGRLTYLPTNCNFSP